MESRDWGAIQIRSGGEDIPAEVWGWEDTASDVEAHRKLHTLLTPDVGTETASALETGIQQLANAESDGTSIQDNPSG